MKIIKKILRHKFILAIVVIALAGGGYFLHGKLNKADAATRYVLAQVTQGNIVTSVSGTGQVQAVNQQDIKSTASGNLTYFGIAAGQQVSAGQVVAKIDSTDAQDAIDTAQATLDQETANLQQMLGTTTASGITIRGVQEKAQDSLDSDYQNAYNTLSSIYLNLPADMTGLDNTLFSYSLSPTQQNIDYYSNIIMNYDSLNAFSYKNDAYNSYQSAKTAYDASLAEYNSLSVSSDPATIDSFLAETYQTLQEVSNAVKAANNLIHLYQNELQSRNLNTQSLAATQISNLNSYTTQVNGWLSSVSSSQNTIQSDKEALAQTATTIANEEKKVADDQTALADAQSQIANYTVTAPFSGVISSVAVNLGDPVSSNTTLATLVSNQNVAKITLNEVDVANVKVGQKVDLTFDALPNLNLSGTVSQIDTVGTVSQGVVDYGVTISFDTQNSQVKPGMSVSADIITDIKQNVVVVPTSAIHTSGGTSYVDVPATSSPALASLVNNTSGVTLDSPPVQQAVQTGASDNSNTEITGGLSAGDIIITRTIAPSSGTSASSQSSSNRSILQTGGGVRTSSGGGAVLFRNGG